MWLRDSANQILSYLPVLRASSEPNSLAALFRGVINVHSRYIKITPYCHAFQPPPESKLPLPSNGAYHRNKVHAFGKFGYDQKKTFDCKWELDSLASFLQLSSEYYNATRDMGPFEKYQWVDTVEVILKAVEAMRTGTYTPDGEATGSGSLRLVANIGRSHCPQRLHHDWPYRSRDGDNVKQRFGEPNQSTHRAYSLHLPTFRW